MMILSVAAATILGSAAASAQGMSIGVRPGGAGVRVDDGYRGDRDWRRDRDFRASRNETYVIRRDRDRRRHWDHDRYDDDRY
jgi:hypothetical protein